MDTDDSNFTLAQSKWGAVLIKPHIVGNRYVYVPIGFEKGLIVTTINNSYIYEWGIDELEKIANPIPHVVSPILVEIAKNSMGVKKTREFLQHFIPAHNDRLYTITASTANNEHFKFALSILAAIRQEDAAWLGNYAYELGRTTGVNGPIAQILNGSRWTLYFMDKDHHSASKLSIYSYLKKVLKENSLNLVLDKISNNPQALNH